MNSALQEIKSLKLKITGQVQGVGFRPFIYRLALKHHLNGWVRNRSGEVAILLQGKALQLEQFQQDLLSQHPPLAIPEIAAIRYIQQAPLNDFEIKASAISEQAQRHIPPDFFTCDDCLAELFDPLEKRYRYPFINCTQCGPRYTIIQDLPYDRPNTSLRNFPLCSFCHKEYTNTLDRRFHAQPLACEECGPELSFHELNSPEKNISGNEVSLSATISALHKGQIIAIKGVGGYHLICDASNEKAVQRLRSRKHRPDKPFAVMFSNSADKKLTQLKHYCDPTQIEESLLTSPQRPIVLIRIKDQTLRKASLASAINPGLNEIGAMLAYSPLHTLILNDFGSPIVATSGNLSGEPVLTDNQQAEARLNTIADVFLQHNRPILRPADDSVIRVIHHKKRLFRIGRGIAPLEFKLNHNIAQAMLAVGGHMKNTIALAWDKRLVVSPHIGELDSKRSIEVFAQVIKDLCHLYRVKPERIICDAHPDYYSTHYAEKYALQHRIPLSKIQHHKAHASIVYGEFDSCYHSAQNKHQGDVTKSPWLIFCWDGTGLGDDNTIWGGEGFYGHAGNWQRVSSIKPFYLQGGDKAAREPWRSACALLWENKLATTLWQKETPQNTLTYQAWKKRLNTVQCSSMGRLFDAASALLNLGNKSSFEGQGPMQLEALLTQTISRTGKLPLALYQENNLLLADWSALLPIMLDSTQSTVQRACHFHEIIAETLIAQALYLQAQKGHFRIGLSGGVFQNKHLSDYLLQRLAEENFSAYLPESIPYNDAGLSFGQIIEAVYR